MFPPVSPAWAIVWNRHTSSPVVASWALMKQRVSRYREHCPSPFSTFPSATMGPLEFAFPSWIWVSQTWSPVRASRATIRASVVAWMMFEP